MGGVEYSKPVGECGDFRHTLSSAQNTRRSEVWRTPKHVGVDAAVALFDFEVPVYAPRSAPRVRTQPVFDTAFHAPPEDFDRMAPQRDSRLVRVHPAFIAEKVLKHRKRAF